jgi:deoxyribodipyrimidine photo-lyase
MAKNVEPVVVFWFRRDLRIDYNTALFHALRSNFRVIPLFIFDTDILSQLDDKHDKRVDFIYHTLCELQNIFQENGSSLYIKAGNPLEVFEKLFDDFNIKAVYTNRDYEQYAINRDRAVKLFLDKKQIDFFSFKDQVIFEWNEVLKSNDEPYTVFTPYSKVWKQKLIENQPIPYSSEKLLGNLAHTEKQPIPELHHIGFSKTGFCFYQTRNKRIAYSGL